MYVVLNKTRKPKKVSMFEYVKDESMQISHESIDNAYSIEFTSDTFVDNNVITAMSKVNNEDLFQVKTEKTVDRTYYYDSIQKDFFKIEHTQEFTEWLKDNPSPE
jgi:hypothetical protein